MGEVDRVRGVDGRQYTISTAQKFDTWETAVFEGGAISVSLGRNLRYVEEVLGNRPQEALMMHTPVKAMVAELPSERWRMDGDAIRRARDIAAEWEVNLKKVYGPEGTQRAQPPSRS